MKLIKQIRIFAFILMLFMLSGCSEDKINSDDTDNNTDLSATQAINQSELNSYNATEESQINSDDTNNNTDLTTNQAINQSEFKSYCAKEENQSNQIFFNYPQFINTDTNTDKMNMMIEDFVKSELYLFIDEDFKGTMSNSHETINWSNDYENYGIDVDYEIMRNDSDYFCAVFKGSTYYKMAPHPNSYFSALIIDVDNLSLVKLSDLYNVNDDFIAVAQRNYEKQINEIELDTLFKEALLEINLEKPEYWECFMTDTALGISVWLNHAMGDHYEFLIDYDELLAFEKC